MAAVLCVCLPWLVPCSSRGRPHGSPWCQVSYWLVSTVIPEQRCNLLTIPSPVLARSVMGMYGSYFFIFIRAIVCIIWYGIQSFYAGNILSVMLRCIFGSAWENLDNTLAASANITSKQLLAFFMAWLMEFPFVGCIRAETTSGTELTIRRCGSTLRVFTTSSPSKVAPCPSLHSPFSAGAWQTAEASELWILLPLLGSFPHL
jgi:hypothetical protein